MYIEWTMHIKLCGLMKRTQEVTALDKVLYQRRAYPWTMMMRYPHQPHPLHQGTRTHHTRMVVLVDQVVHLYLYIHSINSLLADQARSTLCHLKHTGTMVTWAMTLYQKSLKTYKISHPHLPLLPTGTMVVWYDKDFIRKHTTRGWDFLVKWMENVICWCQCVQMNTIHNIELCIQGQTKLWQCT